MLPVKIWDKVINCAQHMRMRVTASGSGSDKQHMRATAASDFNGHQTCCEF